MKRNNLTTAVIAGIAGIAGFASLASAVNLNPDGLGQVLIYPYYTVNPASNAAQQTLIGVVNTTAVGKAVKVRFLEGYDSREVLDFNLFLSPFDVWTATVFSLSDAGIGTAPTGAAITTSDNSCTAPAIANSTLPTLSNGQHYQSFLPFAYTGTFADGGPTGITRTREGHIEMISMADIVPGSGTATAITHVNGVPPGCSSVASGVIPATDLVPPTGGLFGSGGVVNVAAGTFYTYNADAVNGFTGITLYSGTSLTVPSLAQANDTTAGGPATAFVFQNGKLLTASYPGTQAIDSVSAVFAANNVYNNYNVDSGAGSNTDWVVTFPTKRFYVDPAIVGAAGPAIAPFSSVFGTALSCDAIGLTQYDTEEGTFVQTNGFSPPPVTPPSSLCTEVNVISFLPASNANAGKISGVLGSNLVYNIPPFAKNGWAALNLDPAGTRAMRAAANGDAFHGLPVTGFQAVNYVNNNATTINGVSVLSNYAGAFRHRISRNCTNANGACS